MGKSGPSSVPRRVDAFFQSKDSKSTYKGHKLSAYDGSAHERFRRTHVRRMPDAAAWKQRSIYQVVTDRFATTDHEDCGPSDHTPTDYCGGTWQGLITKLDYIQGMGFDAVWISPVCPVNNLCWSLLINIAIAGYQEH
jgi:hypothetical protein